MNTLSAEYRYFPDDVLFDSSKGGVGVSVTFNENTTIDFRNRYNLIVVEKTNFYKFRLEDLSYTCNTEEFSLFVLDKYFIITNDDVTPTLVVRAFTLNPESISYENEIGWDYEKVNEFISPTQYPYRDFEGYEYDYTQSIEYKCETPNWNKVNIINLSE